MCSVDFQALQTMGLCVVTQGKLWHYLIYIHWFILVIFKFNIVTCQLNLTLNAFLISFSFPLYPHYVMSSVHSGIHSVTLPVSLILGEDHPISQYHK